MQGANPRTTDETCVFVVCLTCFLPALFLRRCRAVADFEASFLRLLEKVTNGCSIQINNTGTSLKYKPVRREGCESR